MARTKQAQIKVNLPSQLKDYVDSQASLYGFTSANYLKHLILRDAERLEYSTFKLSKRSEEKLEKALQDIDNAIEITDVDQFFKNL